MFLRAASRLVALAFLAGCAGKPTAKSPAPPPTNPAGATAPSAVPTPPNHSACAAPPTTPFTVVPQTGMGINAEMQFSKDGRIAAAMEPLEIQLWNVPSGTKVAVVTPDAPISQWALRPDGRMVALVSEGHLSLVNPTDPKAGAAAIKVALPANVERVDWKSDGKALFATHGQETSVVDVTGAVTATIAAVSSTGGISLDGRYLFSRDGAMWDIAGNKSRWKASPAASISFSDDGQSVALATGPTITIVDSATGNKRWEVATRGDRGGEVTLSPDGQSVAAYDEGEINNRGYEGRGMVLWHRGKRMRIWQASDAMPQARPAFSPDGKVVGFIASGNMGIELRLADGRTGARVTQVKNDGDIRDVPPRWSGDSRTILQPGANGLLVFDVPHAGKKLLGKASAELTAGSTIYHDAVWSPDDSALLVLAEQNTRSIATVIDLKTGAPRDTLEGKHFRSAQWNAATGLIAIDRSDGVALWDGHAKQPARVIDAGPEDAERMLTFSTRGDVLATLTAPNQEVSLWDTKTGTRLRVLTPKLGSEDSPDSRVLVEGMAFSADGTHLAVRSWLSSGVEQATHVSIYETATGTVVRTLHAPRRYGYAYAYSSKAGGLFFTPQGKGIVSIDPSGRVDLWNATTDDPPTTLIEKAAGGPAALSDSGDTLVMGTPTLDVWDLRTRSLTRELRGDGSTVLATKLAHGAAAIAVTRLDRIELHRLTDRAYLTLRVAPVTTSPSALIVSDHGAFVAPSAAATAATAPLRVRDGAELDVRSLRPTELASLNRPTLALDFVAGCPQ